MQKKHVYFVVIGLAVVVAVAYLWFPSGSGKVDGEKVVSAAHLYTAQLRASGTPVPDSVKLDDLIAKGLLKSEDVSGFKGLDVTVYLSAKTNQPGPAVLLRAKLPDGHDSVVLTDGSVETR